MSDDLVRDIEARDFDEDMARNLAEIVRISVQAGKDEAAQALTEARAEIERMTEQALVKDHAIIEAAKLAKKLMTRAVASESELSTLRVELDVANANHRQMATTMADLARKHDDIRARVREVVGPFADLAQRYDDTVSDGWVSWAEFVADHAWPTETNCRAARQLNEDLK